MPEVTIRPMTHADVLAAERLSAHGFHELDLRMASRESPEPELRPPHRADAWCERTRHLLATDPGGCWVAEDDAGILGIAISFTRELMWVLAAFAVRPDGQGQGTGKMLMAAALHHGRGCLRGMLSASADPRATRRYRQAGFSLHPQMHLTGTVDRSTLPVVEHVREGSAGDIDLMDSVDRRTRGAAHGPDHQLMLRQSRLVVSDSGRGSGYAYVAGDGRVSLLAATDRRTAATLLWESLASTEGRTTVAHVTAANEWAVDVGMSARLDLYQEGFLGLRHLRPPAPYLHHGALL